MTSGNAALQIDVEGKPAERPAAVLRGGTRGLEILIDGRATVDAVIDAVTARLAEAPGFFKGSDVRIRVEDGPLPAGSLGRLDELAATFELRIVEVGAAKSDKRLAIHAGDAIPRPNLAAGSAPTPPRSIDELSPPPPNDTVLATAAALAPALSDPRLFDMMAAVGQGRAWTSPPGSDPVQPSLPLVPVEPPPPPAPESGATELPAQTPSPDQLELALKQARPELEIVPETTRLFVGPVRSGVILDHRGHLVVFGDVNPGAEVRAAGNIVVLGRLRGTAHAGIGAAAGFIVALRLEPQQLRIGRLVARAGDGETATVPEIAYVTGTSIVVERYQGRLPNGLASTLSS